MKTITLALLAVTISAAATSAADLDFSEPSVKTSYSIGYQVGGDFLRQGQDINPEMVVQGVLDALEGREPSIAPAEMRNILTDLQREIAAVRKQQKLEQAQRNLEKGRDFLEKNGRREEVTTLPSGLQYEVLTAGEGASPGATDTVTVHYRGTFIDGTEFDSSYDAAEPVTFRLDGVIEGWSQALQLMKEGGKWLLTIPPELAYRDQQSGAIEPNSTLIFEVELISVSRQ